MYKHILYIHIYTGTFIIYIYSNLLLLEQKIMNTKSLNQVKEAWSWRITRKLVNTRWRPWSTNLAEANSWAVKSQGHKLSFFPSRSRFKAFPSPVTSTNTKNLSFQSHADLEQILKYDGLGIADTEQLVFICHREPGSLHYLSFPFSPFQDTLHFISLKPFHL